jgi:mono/diheme cytochrome c family protein
MKKLLAALLLLPLTQTGAFAQGAAPAGDAAAGKMVWEAPTSACKNCHGQDGQGAFGPDLAGRGLSFQEFRQAVRKPWGIMPAFVETQFSDKQLADMTSYFGSLQKVSETGPWRTEVPAGAPLGQETLVNMGCGQCHGADFNGPRGNLGGINASYEEFADLVYHHTTALPKERAMLGNKNLNIDMGNFNPTRMRAADLRDIYNWTRDDIGFRVPLQGRLSKGEAGAGGVTYTLDVVNGGLPGRGLTAEGVTVALIVPAGTNVVSATGPGYQGVHTDDKTKAQMAVWTLPSSAPKEQAKYTITLSKAGTAADNLKGEIRWMKPAPKNGPNKDVVNIAPAPL